MLGRRLFLVALLGLVVLVCVGLGSSTTAAASSNASAATQPSAATHDADHAERPCALRADCAGAGLLAGVGMLLLLPATAPRLFQPAPATAVPSVPVAVHPALLAGRLFRPPRHS